MTSVWHVYHKIDSISKKSVSGEIVSGMGNIESYRYRLRDVHCATISISNRYRFIGFHSYQNRIKIGLKAPRLSESSQYRIMDVEDYWYRNNIALGLFENIISYRQWKNPYRTTLCHGGQNMTETKDYDWRGRSAKKDKMFWGRGVETLLCNPKVMTLMDRAI